MQITIHITGESYHLIGYKHIGNRKREMLKRGIHHNTVFPGNRRIQRSVSNHNLRTFMCQVRIHILFASLTRKPGSSQRNITDTLALVSQLINAGFSRKLQRVFRLYIVGFGRKQSGNIGHIGQDTKQFIQPDTAQLDIHILQRNRITWQRLHPDSHPFIILHIYIGINTHIIVQINPVVMLLKAKLMESNDRLLRYQGQGNSIPLTTTTIKRLGVDSKK